MHGRQHQAHRWSVAALAAVALTACGPVQRTAEGTAARAPSGTPSVHGPATTSAPTTTGAIPNAPTTPKGAREPDTVPDEAAAYALAFLTAWQSGDRAGLARLATPEVAAQAAASAVPTSPAFRGCAGAARGASCTWTTARGDLVVRVLQQAGPLPREHEVVALRAPG